MHLTRLAAVAIASVALSFAAVQADTPAHRYTVDLGAGNEDLEVKIDALPWIPAPIGVHRVKDASNINFAGRDLRCAELHFELNGLYGANFAGCKLDGSSFAETPLYGCSFRDASLRFCVFDRFHPMSDDSNDFSNADIEGSSVPGLPADCLKQTRNYRQGRLRGIRMLDNITGVSFKNMTLDACYLAGRWQTCDGCDLTNASLQRMVITPGFSEQQIRSTDNGQSRDYAEILFLGFGRGEGWQQRARFHALGFFPVPTGIFREL